MGHWDDEEKTEDMLRDETHRLVTVSTARFRALYRALESLVTGDFESRALEIEPSKPDAFGAMEAMVQLVARRHVEAIGQVRHTSLSRHSALRLQHRPRQP